MGTDILLKAIVAVAAMVLGSWGFWRWIKWASWDPAELGLPRWTQIAHAKRHPAPGFWAAIGWCLCLIVLAGIAVEK
jgi:hypothetical protein